MTYKSETGRAEVTRCLVLAQVSYIARIYKIIIHSIPSFAVGLSTGLVKPHRDKRDMILMATCVID